MKRILIVVSAILVFSLWGCVTPELANIPNKSEEAFIVVEDIPTNIEINKTLIQLKDRLEKRTVENFNLLVEKLNSRSEEEKEDLEIIEENYTEEYIEYTDYSANYSGVTGYYGDGGEVLYGENGPTRYMPGYYDGRKETYYSSNVLPHYRMNEWTVDDEGFYRTDEGYYVVGVGLGEMNIGDTFETGKGTAIVMDYGYTENITDFYTNW